MPYIIDTITAGSVDTKVLLIDGAPLSTGLEGTNYILVKGAGTPTENASELISAYNTAKTTAGLSANYRFTIVVAPGEYKFPTTFIMDTPYIDIVSLTGNRDVVVDLDVVDPVLLKLNGDIQTIFYPILIQSDNIFLKGINGKIVPSANWNTYYGYPTFKLGIDIATNLPNIVVENCYGGEFSFGSDYTQGTSPKVISGTFKNCQGEYASFAYYGTASGTFENCTNFYSGFGYVGTASGVFTNCQGQGAEFGFFGVASGTFRNCIVNDVDGFGYRGTCSGTFISCKAINQAFGYRGITSGQFYNCIASHTSYGDAGTLSGKLFYCRLTLANATFPVVSGGGRTYYCVDGNGNPNNQ